MKNGIRQAGESPPPIATKRYLAAASLVLILLSGAKAERVIEENYPVLAANLAGNEFAGVTPDWENYFRASKWIKNNLPMQSTGIICRKPELFLLYAGDYPVYGIYRIDQEQPDSIVATWKARHMTHLLYDNFQWSSTLRRYVFPVAQKYPSMFEFIHRDGTDEQFPSFVFRLNYAVYDSLHEAMLHAAPKK